MDLKKIKAVFTDVDGCLTDARLYMDGREELVAFNIQDGIGQRLLESANIPVVWLSGRFSSAVKSRAKKLGVCCIHLGHTDKVTTARKTCLMKKWKLSEIAYLGDDLIDLPLMKLVGWPVAPANARPEVKKVAKTVLKAKGGDGAFREMTEMLLKRSGRWPKTLNAYLKKTLQ